MTPEQKARILSITGGSSIEREELIQPLWNNYGRLSRIFLRGAKHPSIIAKHIRVPNHVSHPRGFTTSLSNQRKLDLTRLSQLGISIKTNGSMSAVHAELLGCLC